MHEEETPEQPVTIKEEKKEMRETKKKERKARRRGPKKVPSIILEKQEEKDDERYMTIRFSPKLLKSAPLWKRSRRAIRLLQQFILKHIKYVEATIDEATGTRAKVRITEPVVWISPEVNEIIWSRGSKNPPKKVRIRVLIKVEDIIRDPEGKPIGCRAELRVFPI